MVDTKLPRSDDTLRKTREREEREKRLAAALRSNLAKRKAQQRRRNDVGGDEKAEK